MSGAGRPVVRFQHAGVFCAIPLEQVGAADRTPPESQSVVRLWTPAPATDAAGAAEGGFVRHLRITTPSGDRWIEGRRIAVASLRSSVTWPLPDLVRAALGLPHVVALTELDGDLVWLVDPGRLEEVDSP